MKLMKSIINYFEIKYSHLFNNKFYIKFYVKDK